MEAADLGRVPNRVDSSPVDSPKSPNPDLANGGQQVTRARASGQQVTTGASGQQVTTKASVKPSAALNSRLNVIINEEPWITVMAESTIYL